jgi:aminoglycoside 3'-phosphotransferase II
MSEARVWRLDGEHAEPRYFKVAKGAAKAQLRREIERTLWLASRKVRVPTILRTHEDADFVALLSDAVPGVVATDADLSPALLAAAIGRGLAELHALAVAECPFDETLRIRLARARRLIRQGKIETNDFEDRNRHLAPQALLERLCAQRPDEKLVVAHGDATLSNMLVDQDATLGFVDCGHCGKADRYLDLAIAAQEIAENFGGNEARIFVKAYGEMTWDNEKARFFSDLYELF